MLDTPPNAEYASTYGLKDKSNRLKAVVLTPLRTKKGKIKYVRVHEPQLGQWSPPVFWLSLEGLAGFGSCKTWHGNVLLIAEHEFFFSMVLETQAQGNELAVMIDDKKIGAGGYCRAVYITTGNPPPTL